MSLADIIESTPYRGSLTQIGHIKIGGKDPNDRKSSSGGTWRAPVKWDSFKVCTMNRDGKGDLIPDAALMDCLKKDPDGKLREIPIRVLSDDIADIMQASYVWYGGKTVAGRSDGKTVTWFCSPDPLHYGKRYPTPIEQPWAPEMLELKSPKGVQLFKLHTVFNCVIASEQARFGGVYKLRTTSVISFRQLHESLTHLSGLTGGVLAAMPLVMVMRPIQVSPEGKATTVYVVHVEMRGKDVTELQQRAMELAKFRITFAEEMRSNNLAYKKILALPGFNESDAEAKDVAEEFAPEEQANHEIQTVGENESYGLLDEPSGPDAEVVDTTEGT